MYGSSCYHMKSASATSAHQDVFRPYELTCSELVNAVVGSSGNGSSQKPRVLSVDADSLMTTDTLVVAAFGVSATVALAVNARPLETAERSNVAAWSQLDQVFPVAGSSPLLGLAMGA
jgi:hypothetical protein